jgi:hypothetical protein
MVPGFAVTTFKAAFLGALALAVLHLLFGWERGEDAVLAGCVGLSESSGRFLPCFLSDASFGTV